MLQTDPLAHGSSLGRPLAGAPLHSGHSRHYEPGGSDATPAGSLSGLEPRSPRCGAPTGRGRSAAVPRECDCPPWVACVHFDETILVLSSGESNNHDASCYRATSTVGGPYVGLLDEWIPCSGCGIPQASGTPFFFDSFEEAQAEFRRREAALLGRTE